MFRLTELKAGDFIDLLTWSKLLQEQSEESEMIIEKFYLLLINRLPTTEKECFEVVEEFGKQIEEIKESFEFIYNPPQLPITTEQKERTIGDEYRDEFFQMYQYPELVYKVATVFSYKPSEVLELKTQDFLFWANYLVHKKFVENIK
jgi:hypothetical protein